MHTYIPLFVKIEMFLVNSWLFSAQIGHVFCLPSCVCVCVRVCVCVCVRERERERERELTCALKASMCILACM